MYTKSGDDLKLKYEKSRREITISRQVIKLIINCPLCYNWNKDSKLQRFEIVRRIIICTRIEK